MRSLSLLVLATLLALGGCNKLKSLGEFEGEITMRTTAAGAASDMVVKTKGDRLRFDMKAPNGDPMHGVFDPKANKVTVFLDGTKTYMDMDFSKPGATPNVDGASGSVSKTGKHETVAGYDCENWTVSDPTKKRTELCIAQGIAFFDVGGLKAGPTATPSALAKEFREKKSFPLRSIEYDASGKELSRMEVTKIEKQSIDDAAFLVPPEYTKFQLPLPSLPSHY
jgi:Domain of unknown function (DUF4412)